MHAKHQTRREKDKQFLLFASMFRNFTGNRTACALNMYSEDPCHEIFVFPCAFMNTKINKSESY